MTNTSICLVDINQTDYCQNVLLKKNKLLMTIDTINHKAHADTAGI